MSNFSQQGGGFAFPQLTSAVRLLIWINLIVFLIGFVIGPEIAGLLGVSLRNVTEGFGLGVVRLVTSIFTHSFLDPTHILFNMLGLYFFGTFIESSSTGRLGLIRLYFLAGIAGGITQLAVNLVLGADGPTIGASGAVYAIMAYAAVLAPRMRVIFIIFPIELRWLVGFFVLIGAYSLAVSLRLAVGGGGVAHGAHLGGALYGFLAAMYFRQFHTTPVEYLPPGRNGFFQVFSGMKDWMDNQQRVAAQRSAQKDQQRKARDQEVLDSLLAKVKDSGLDSLTPAERRFLQKASESMRR